MPLQKQSLTDSRTKMNPLKKDCAILIFIFLFSSFPITIHSAITDDFTTIQIDIDGSSGTCIYVSNYAIWPFEEDPSAETNKGELECQKMGLALLDTGDANIKTAMQELASKLLFFVVVDET